MQCLSWSDGKFRGRGLSRSYNIDTATSELGHLWYDTLGNTAHRDTDGDFRRNGNFGLTSTGPFHNLVKDQYWSRTDYEHSVGTNSAWDFNAEGGRQENHSKEWEFLAWAVRPGKVDVATSDVQPVPTPATLWLVGAGLLGLGLRRRRWVLRRFG